MKRKNKGSDISFSQEYNLHYSKTRDGFPIDRTDWERLRGLIQRFTKFSIIWWAVFSFLLSLAIELLLNYLIADIKNPYRAYFFDGFLVTTTGALLTLIFAFVQKRSEEVKKVDILNEMKRLEAPLEEEDEVEDTDLVEGDLEKDNSSELKVINGTYGTSSKSVDVTQKLIEMITDGKLIFVVSNSLSGSDPEPGVVKTLVVKYEFNAQEVTREFKENDQVNLP